mmetsp:Transcript_7681/g.24265  ORF Transcript_7681/g.24265 Transcript_7681/m.24265 type:complete len:267 (-) Transcript_7681:573-1373(-)
MRWGWPPQRHFPLAAWRPRPLLRPSPRRHRPCGAARPFARGPRSRAARAWSRRRARRAGAGGRRGRSALRFSSSAPAPLRQPPPRASAAAACRVRPPACPRQPDGARSPCGQLGAPPQPPRGWRRPRVRSCRRPPCGASASSSSSRRRARPRPRPPPFPWRRPSPRRRPPLLGRPRPASRRRRLLRPWPRRHLRWEDPPPQQQPPRSRGRRSPWSPPSRPLRRWAPRRHRLPRGAHPRPAPPAVLTSASSPPRCTCWQTPPRNQTR